MPRDPVCGMNIREDNKGNLRSEYRGQSYHFCSDRCRQEFDRNPANFVRDDQNRNRPEGREDNRDDRRPR